ncbi:peptidylprolyl isomerase [Streptococcus zalophi]|uniref:Peptidyl-prolyl cis-trans isomerase n=1 Tax=Streptococcus zalophi TaxID=640031 RepID=A0A934PAL3_9STRE|nr:peptidylprolyl isomerase [Streptococcus zalophi]MBJ8349880.1 peptidylprolyl isomerase [Streptococcus zalophi]
MKKIILLALGLLLFLTGCSSEAKDTQETTQEDPIAERLEKLNKADFPQLSTTIADNEAAVKIVTSKGDITIKLFPELAPLAVENFLTHAKEGYYDGVIFHRVIDNFMIQTGDPKGDGTGGESIWQGKDESIDAGNGFVNEPSDYLYNIRGALSMANAGPDTNGSQFFINQNTFDQTSKLDPRYFPKKIIQAYSNGGNPSLDFQYTVFGQVIEGMDVVDSIASVPTDDKDKPQEDIVIKTIEITKDYTFK